MLSDAQMSDFERDGFVVVEDAVEPERLAAVKQEYEVRLAALRSEWVASGALDVSAPHGDFQSTILSAYRAGVDYFRPLDISLPGGKIHADTPFHAGPAAFDLLTSPRLLDLVESLIGPEIVSNPIQHVRIKPPSTMLRDGEINAHVGQTEWHQDRGVTLEEADETRMVTVWLAVTDATVDNGCLRALRGSHKGEMLTHCPLPQVGIPDALIDKAAETPLPVRAGGAVIFHPLTVHGSLPNRSSGVRWSFDLRYNVAGEPTGRPFFPEFLARSRARPEDVLRDSAAWADAWRAARARLAVGGSARLHRWDQDAPLCA